ncbi:MAG: HypC/HybG/HupF family hydrogenase formation chaperone [Gammaproteobacteria bacterium]|nr:HypC/HybG/HupF family hydrogenase formation chaperone [Gammaproteobacteria bacterium]MCP5317896.1 HypC/HybG/HupF family hydrogenase formation chaperone [Chromatiaceae bacterium]MCW5585276.1 HypC/HybG/HupF family hydrogenase formation chaperone [Chromatiales bacterium]MCB1817842.1 HypC/HybG/HupF family hydrogenase formation chaperone [Gammaproteobacteria bacterium]MCP5429093.1 HypC/HybG/HupF family hydrogenase formation chaperone [Chromatiaceae bacterium]
MCLAIPAQVVEIDDVSDSGTVALGPVRKRISLALVDDVSVGDFVLIHVGYALNKISPEEAERTLALFGEAELVEELAAAPGGGAT